MKTVAERLAYNEYHREYRKKNKSKTLRDSKKWKDENRAAIKAYNSFVEENGCFGNEYRSF